MAHIQKRGDRWQARYRRPDGKEETQRFDRKVDAEKWLTRKLVAMDHGEWTDPVRARILVAEWGERWLESKATLKASTRADYRSLWEVLIKPRWGDVRLCDVSHQDVATWVARLSTRVGASRCSKAAILFSGMMAAAVRDQRIARNPADGVRLPRLKPKPQRFLNHAQLQQLADAAGPYKVMVLVLGFTGLRFGECIALKVADVDLLRRRLLVSQSVSEVNGKLEWSTPKTHQSREVPIGRYLADLLAYEVQGKTPKDLLFGSPEGEPLRLSNWRRRVWDPAVAETGLTGLTPHDLRHTAASLAVASKADVKQVQRMLGHASAAMTLDVYAGLFENDLDELTDRQDAAISRANADIRRTDAPSGVIRMPSRSAENGA
jgi:integrase